MVFNRRHKAILFITLVTTGCALLLGAELKETLGFMLLGVALAWAIGSDAASKLYTGLKVAPGRVYPWIRPILTMSLAGGLIGALMLFSRGNPVGVIAASCFIGIVGAPFVQLPTQKAWLRIPIALVASCLFVVAAGLIIETDVIANHKYGARFAELTITSLAVVVSGIFWLSKGWQLIIRGITAEPRLDGIPITSAGLRRTWPQYISVLLGISVLTLWLCLACWSASGDWAYAPDKLSAQKNNNNLLITVGFVILLAWWPYSSWRTILERQPNSESRYLKLHKGVTAVIGMCVAVFLGLAITLGIQNGDDRIMTDQVTDVLKDFKAVAGKIGAIKQRDLETTGDYIQAFSEVGALLPELESDVNRFTDIYHKMNEKDANRGIINMQRFYKTYTPEYQKNLKEQIDVIEAMLSVNKQEVESAKEMSALPVRNQPEFWKENFRPLLIKESSLRDKALALDAQNKSLLN